MPAWPENSFILTIKATKIGVEPPPASGNPIKQKKPSLVGFKNGFWQTLPGAIPWKIPAYVLCFCPTDTESIETHRFPASSTLYRGPDAARGIMSHWIIVPSTRHDIDQP